MAPLSNAISGVEEADFREYLSYLYPEGGWSAVLERLAGRIAEKEYVFIYKQ